MSTVSNSEGLAPAVPVPEPVVEETVLPELSNGITPSGQPSLPVVEEIVPATMPVSDSERLSEVPVSVEYRSPVEAVPGVGGIPGVQAE